MGKGKVRNSIYHCVTPLVFPPSHDFFPISLHLNSVVTLLSPSVSFLHLHSFIHTYYQFTYHSPNSETLPPSPTVLCLEN